MNLVVLQGKNMRGDNTALFQQFSGMLSEYDTKKTQKAALTFAEGLIDSLSIHYKDKPRHEMMDYRGLGFADINQLAWGLELARLAITHFPEDINFKPLDTKVYKYIWQGGLSVSFNDAKDGLIPALKELSTWDWFNTGKEPNFARIAILGLDFAWRMHLGVKVEGTWWDSSMQNSSYLNWFLGKKGDEITKEMEAATQRFVSLNQSAADTRGTIIEVSDKVEAVYNKVINAAGDATFKIFGTAQMALAVMPMGLVLGYKPSNKKIFYGALAVSAIPMYILGRNIYNYATSTSTKIIFGAAGGIGGFGAGFGLGYGLKKLYPAASSIGKAYVKHKTGYEMHGKKRRRLK